MWYVLVFVGSLARACGLSLLPCHSFFQLMQDIFSFTAMGQAVIADVGKNQSTLRPPPPNLCSLDPQWSRKSTALSGLTDWSTSAISAAEITLSAAVPVEETRQVIYFVGNARGWCIPSLGISIDYLREPPFPCPSNSAQPQALQGGTREKFRTCI